MFPGNRMSPAPSGDSSLNRETILRAPGQLSDDLERRGVTGEACLFGGTVMVFEEGKI